MFDSNFGKQSKRAFSLLEVAIVIVIIGLLIVGVLGSKHIISRARVATAQSMTFSSAINGIMDNAMWLESSLQNVAFVTTNGGSVADADNINGWNDNSNNQHHPVILKVGSGPTIANTINYIPAVRFNASGNGSDSNYLQINNAEFLNNTDYTIFVLEKRMSSSGDNYFIGDSSNTTDDQTLILGYSASAQVIHSQGSGNNYTSSIESYGDYSNKQRVFTFVSDSTNGKKTYINSTLAAEDSDTTQLSNITSLPIGKDYDGEIGELVIFTRALKDSERREVENYLFDKWKAPNTRSKSASCLNGTVSVSGCVASCVVSIEGESTTSLLDGQSEDFDCDQAGYSDSVSSYTCSGGETITDSCDPVVCSASSGSGYSSQSGLAYATSGSGSFACDEGYSGSINYTCTSTGAATITGGSCSTISCTASSGSGYSSQTGLAYAASGSGSFACDEGYSGSISYTCTSTGAATITGGSCSAITCTAASGTGYGAQSGLAYATSGSGTFDCDASGYSGTINYTCTSTGAATITGGSCSASSASGDYLVVVNPFPGKSLTTRDEFEIWFNDNNCVVSDPSIGANPGSYSFNNGTITNTSSGWVVWLVDARDNKYYRNSGWTSMTHFTTQNFNASIAAIGCSQ